MLKKQAKKLSAKFKTQWTEVFFCNLIKPREKGEEKRGKKKREWRDALLITEPSAKSWKAANSTGSWERGIGREREERESGGRWWEMGSVGGAVVDVEMGRGTQKKQK